MPTITLIALPQCLASAITLPMEMLNAADALARTHDRLVAPIKMTVAGENPGLLTTAGGLAIHVNASYHDIEHCDLLLLPALWRNPLHTIRQQRELLDWVRQMAANGSLICAAGTSSFLLAEAGLLDNKAATTHWYYLDTFQRRYPKVQLKKEFLITQAGNIYCAGSVNSVADLMVHIIANLYNSEISHRVEAQFSPEIRQPFESHAHAQQSGESGDRHRDEAVIQAQEQLREQCQDSGLDLAATAAELGLTTRTFNRRFKQATGVTPGSYVLQQRIRIAKELLLRSNLSISEIAVASGFTDSSHFCCRFKHAVNQTPLTFRKAVRGKLFDVV